MTLLYAETEAEARELAEENFRSDEGTYKSADGHNVTITPTAVVDVVAALIDDLSEGGDLYSRHFRDFEAYSKWEPMLNDRVSDNYVITVGRGLLRRSWRSPRIKSLWDHRSSPVCPVEDKTEHENLATMKTNKGV